MDMAEYKPSDAPYTMPHPVWYVWGNETFMLGLVF